MSRPPYVVIAWSTIAAACSKSATSAPLTTARPPAASISATTSSAGVSPVPSPDSETPKSLTTTAAPCAASSSACARPIPRPAPVTMATRPSSSPLTAAPSRDVQEDRWLAAAVAGHPGAGDVRREVAGQEHGDAPDLLGPGHPAQRNRGFDRGGPPPRALV